MCICFYLLFKTNPKTSKKKKNICKRLQKKHEYLQHFKYFYFYFCGKVQAQNERVN